MTSRILPDEEWANELEKLLKKKPKTKKGWFSGRQVSATEQSYEPKLLGLDFVEGVGYHINCDAALFLEHANTIYCNAAFAAKGRRLLRSAQFWSVAPCFEALLESSSLSYLTQLVIVSQPFTPPMVRSFLSCLYLRNLTSLSLTGIALGEAGAILLADSPHLFNKLEQLTLDTVELGDAGVVALANSRWITNLVSLNLRHNNITDKGIRTLAFSPVLKNLKNLNLNTNYITDDGAMFLIDSPNLSSLEQLNLSCMVFTPQAVAALQRHFKTKIYLTSIADSADTSDVNKQYAPPQQSEVSDDLQDLKVPKAVAEASRVHPFLVRSILTHAEMNEELKFLAETWKSSEDATVNNAMIEIVKGQAQASQLKLLYEGRPVNIRQVKRSFQLRFTGSNQEPACTNLDWPSLISAPLI